MSSESSSRQWQFVTNHTQVLLCIARDADVRLRDIADSVGITVGSAQRIVADLIEAGFVERTREGRRNRYIVKRGTPMLRQYEYFTRVFLWTFLALLPPSLLGLFPAATGRWLTVPLSLAIGLVYSITARTGQVTEDPFENRIHDVPLTALCTTIERDLRDALGETELPPAAEPVDGYLY